MQIPGIAIFWTSKKLLILSNGIIFKSAFLASTSVPNYVGGLGYSIKTFLVVCLTTDTPRNNFLATRCTSGLPSFRDVIFIPIEVLAQSIRHSDIIKGIKIQANQEVKQTTQQLC